MASDRPTVPPSKPHERVLPLDVECFECGAKPGNWCIVPGNGRRTDGYHRARRHFALTGDKEAALIVVQAGSKVNAKLRELAERRKQAQGVT